MNDHLYMSLIGALPRRRFSWTVRRLAGWEGSSAVSRAGVRAFAKAFGINVAEAEHPIESYPNIQAFFTRRLKPGARTVDPGEDAVVSPVDGVVSQWGEITGGELTQVKGQTYTVADLLGGAEQGAPYVGGSYITIYLSPRHYHRIHTPVEGEIVAFDHIPGELWPVNAPSVRNVSGLFGKNERVVTYVRAEDGARIGVVKVAAVGVGHISLAYADRASNLPNQTRHYETLTHPRPVERGGELGTFELGSTVILVFPPGWVDFEPLQEGQEVQMGQRIARRTGEGSGR